MKYQTVTEITNFEEWDKVAIHPIQTSWWINTKESTSNILLIEGRKNGELKKIFAGTPVKIPFLQKYLYTFPMCDEPDASLITFLQHYGRQNKIPLFLFEPYLQIENENKNLDKLQLIKKLGLQEVKTRIYFDWTRVVDLESMNFTSPKSFFSETWMRHIKTAIKTRVSFRKVDYNDKKYNNAVNLITQTAQREKFGIRDQNFFANIQSLLESGNLQVHITEIEGNVASANFYLIHKHHAYYIYGGSDLKYSKNYTSKFLFFESMKKLKDEGIKQLDLWGIAPQDNPNEKHPLTGITFFKQGIKGEDYKLLPTLQLKISPLYAILLQIYNTIFRKHG